MMLIPLALAAVAAITWVAWYNCARRPSRMGSDELAVLVLQVMRSLRDAE